MAEVNNALEKQEVARTVLDSEYAVALILLANSVVFYVLYILLGFL